MCSRMGGNSFIMQDSNIFVGIRAPYIDQRSITCPHEIFVPSLGTPLEGKMCSRMGGNSFIIGNSKIFVRIESPFFGQESNSVHSVQWRIQ